MSRLNSSPITSSESEAMQQRFREGADEQQVMLEFNRGESTVRRFKAMARGGGTQWRGRG